MAAGAAATARQRPAAGFSQKPRSLSSVSTARVLFSGTSAPAATSAGECSPPRAKNTITFPGCDVADDVLRRTRGIGTPMPAPASPPRRT